MTTTKQQTSEDNLVWSNLYTSLSSIINKRIHEVDLKLWHGQERDLAEDIAQEAIVRTFIQTQKAQKGEASPVLSLFHFGKKVATNHLYDRARKDFRLVRPSNDIVIQEKLIVDNWVDPTEEILDDIDNVALFTLIAQVIVEFPVKQKTALLVDLAMLSSIGVSSSPLQEALEKVGIRLDVYSSLAPKTVAEKGRHSALLSLSYKRLKKVVRARLQLQDTDC